MVVVGGSDGKRAREEKQGREKRERKKRVDETLKAMDRVEKETEGRKKIKGKQ